jgi:hypothetical protein
VSWRRYITGGVLAGAVLMLALTRPVAAECTGQPNSWPAFTAIAPTANRVIIGRVTRGDDQFESGSHVAYIVRVVEVLRGSAPDTIRVSGLRSGLALSGNQSCREAAYLSARVGDVIAIAFDGRVEGSDRPVTGAAWITGRPDPFHAPGAQRLTLEQARRAVLALPPTSTETGRASDDSRHHAMLVVAFAAGLFLKFWAMRLRR